MFTRQHILLLLVILLCAQSASIAQIQVTDDLGRVITVNGVPKRIVSLAPSITETLFAIGAGGQVTGVTDYCNYPAEAAQRKRVGGVINPNIEAVVGLKPDLIILSMEGNVREDFTKLTALGVPVFVTNPRTMQGIEKSIKDLGTLTGHSPEATTVVEDIEGRAGRLSMRMGPRVERSVMLIVAVQPLIVVGEGTFIDELIARAGGRNIAAGSPSTYPTYSRESVLKENPNIIVAMSDAIKETNELTTVFPEWENLKAVREGMVFRIDSDIVSRPGPRVIDALEMLNSIIQSGRPR